MRKDYLVSIIVPLYKGAQYVKPLIHMLQENQSNLLYKCDTRLEIIFVNDYPVEIVRVPDIKEIGVKLLNMERNQGIHAARVRGFEEASGEYIVFLDQDDSITPDYIVSQVQHIQDNDAVLCNGIYRGERLIYSESNPQNDALNIENIIDRQCKIISPGQVMIKKSAIPKEWLDNIFTHNGLDDSFLWLLMVKKHMTFAFNRALLYRHNENGANGSFNWKEMRESKLEMQRIVKKLGILDEREEARYDEKIKFSVQKSDSYIKLDKLWGQLKKEKVTVGDFLEKRGYKKVAIYAMGIYGMRLYEELKNTKIQVCYGIDQNADAIKGVLKIFSKEDDYPLVDIIINTATFLNDDIKNFIHRKSYMKVIGLDELLEDIVLGEK